MAANVLAPSGFQSGRLYGSGAPNYAIRTAKIAYNYGTQIADGDPVYLYTDGTIRLFANGGTTIHGIFRGCKYVDPGLQRVQWYPAWRAPTLAADTNVVAEIEVDPEMTFRAQVNGAAITQASIGLNIDITASTSGQPTTAGMSVCSLLSSSAAASATLPFRIVGIVTAPAINRLYNETYDNNWVEVTMNTSDITTRTGQA